MKKLTMFVGVLGLALGLTGCAGHVGSTGPQGPQGEPGQTGPQGEPGTDGLNLLTGKGEPAASLGNAGDSYIDTETWDYYVKGNSGWIKQGNIKGQDGTDGEKGSQGDKGETGDPGADGTSVLTGAGVPSSSLGVVGDSYIDTNTWDYYVKADSGWFKQGNIKGQDGDKGDSGEDGLDGEDGKSAYELYCDEHPEYEGTLEQWLEDLANGNLSTTYHTVSFETGTEQQIETQEVKHLAKISKPADPERKGYTFNGWTYLGETWSFAGYVVTEDMTLIADWEANTYHVTFNPTGGKLDTFEVDYVFDEEVTLPVPTKDEVIFLGWTYKGAFVENGSWAIADDCILIAAWRQDSYIVEYDYGYGGLSSSEEITYGDYFNLPYPEREGYKFIGWLDEEGNVVASQDYLWLHDLKLMAAWKAVETIVTLNPGDGGLEEVMVTISYDQDFELPVPTGDNFNGWYYDDRRITDETGKGLKPWDIIDYRITLEAFYFIPVYDEEGLRAMSEDLDANYRLMDDIILTEEWVPIGTKESPFFGSFDGDGHSVSGLSIIESGDSYLGLFGYFSGSSVSNVNFVAATIKASYSLSNQDTSYAGLIAGYISSKARFTRINVDETSSINAERQADRDSYVGGIAGYCNSTIDILSYSNCADVTASGCVGGFVGFGSATIESSSNSGVVAGSDNVGGLIGHGDDHSPTYIKSSFNFGDVSGSNNVGGMVGNSGSFSSISIDSSFNFGNVIASDSYAGGFVGEGSTHSEASIRFSSNSGSVSGYSNIGGLIGCGLVSITSSSNYGNVTGSYIYTYVGGMVGKGDATIASSSNFGDVAGSENVGGFLGAFQLSTAISDCSNSGDVAGSKNVGGLVGGCLYIGDKIVSIERSSNSGDISGSDSVGGLVGQAPEMAASSSFVACDVKITSSGVLVGPVYGSSDFSEVINCHYLCDFIDASGNGYNGDNNLDGLPLDSVDQITEEFFSDTLGWDLSLWDFSNFDPTNGVFPVPTGLPSVES